MSIVQSLFKRRAFRIIISIIIIAIIVTPTWVSSQLFPTRAGVSFIGKGN